jgi:hypothetical protein
VNNPYKTEEITCISFSGGRTSAYMLHQILEAYGGLPEHMRVIFANTGKEMPQTLDFVQECATRWDVPITWLECLARRGIEGENKYVYETHVVDWWSASRNGEPFESLIDALGYLPNPMTRFCTDKLKISRINDFMNGLYPDDEWIAAVGIRADEPRRVAKMRAQDDKWIPLVDAGIGVQDVGDFWRNQTFDLALPNNGGATDLGNCDLCFLKGYGKRQSIINHHPGLAAWWAKQEEKTGRSFDRNGPSYSEMLARAGTEPDMFLDDDISCFCGD